MSSPSLCPKCGWKRSEVVRTTTIEGASKRERRCYDCDSRWYTVEMPIERYRVVQNMERVIDDVLRGMNGPDKG